MSEDGFMEMFLQCLGIFRVEILSWKLIVIWAQV